MLIEQKKKGRLGIVVENLLNLYEISSKNVSIRNKRTKIKKNFNIEQDFT